MKGGDVNWDWLAGFFDAEGCVRLNRRVRNGRNYYYPRLVITQNRRWLLQQVKELVGNGRIYRVQESSGGPVYQIHWDHRQAVALGTLLVERCILKAPQLRTLIEADRWHSCERRGFARLLRTQKKDLGEDDPLPSSPRS